jgi:hypothetical protein
MSCAGDMRHCPRYFQYLTSGKAIHGAERQICINGSFVDALQGRVSLDVRLVNEILTVVLHINPDLVDTRSI